MGSRYYDSSSDEIRPGRISADLRKALNIAENDLPIWIYRMRALGYPPGWLKKAVVDTDDIFDTDSPSKTTAAPQYDYSRLIEYPGFNSPIPEGCNDYHYFVNMPAMLPHQQLDYAKKHMNLFKPAQLPKRAIIDYKEDPIDTNETQDNNDEDEAEDKVKESGAEDKQVNEKPLIEVKKESIDIMTKESDTKTPVVKLEQEIKLVSKGSPMPKPSPRISLEKFSEGVVGDLLYFENLPNAKGKFDDIRKLLHTIRKPSDDSLAEPNH